MRSYHKHRMFNKFCPHWVVWIPTFPSIWQLLESPFSSQPHSSSFLTGPVVCTAASHWTKAQGHLARFLELLLGAVPLLYYPNPQIPAASSSLLRESAALCLGFIMPQCGKHPPGSSWNDCGPRLACPLLSADCADSLRHPVLGLLIARGTSSWPADEVPNSNCFWNSFKIYYTRISSLAWTYNMKGTYYFYMTD